MLDSINILLLADDGERSRQLLTLISLTIGVIRIFVTWGSGCFHLPFRTLCFRGLPLVQRPSCRPKCHCHLPSVCN